MIISYRWLLEYLPKPLPSKDFLSLDELCVILTSIGLEVEGTEISETIPGSLDGLVIGEVLTCAKHPNADKLSITTVNIGKEVALHIVCGAPNVAAGQKVVVAPVGSTVYPTKGDPFAIKKSKIRGEESAGMICAEDEIGLGESHAGIMILPEDAVPGVLAKDYFMIPEADYAIHIGLTPNRADANSHLGVAQDVCAYLSHHKHIKQVVQLPEAELQIKHQYSSPISVEIEATEACKRYAGLYIENIIVGDSPEWLVNRLKTIGVRSINNIVDITNFVLHEYGQPLHAFDADKIAGKKIAVKFLPENTVFLGLDGKERKLQANDLMICDANGAIAMGGVFGGAESGISEQTKNVFLESAFFDATHIRRTSMFHQLRTDAATHFEKGVDIGNVLPALKRAAGLICTVAGGVVKHVVIDSYKDPIKPKTVSVSYEFIRKLSGKDYTIAQISQILTGLGFEILSDNSNDFTVCVPTNKPDVLQPADIVEEIVRIDGLDSIAIPERLNISLSKPLTNDRDSRDKISDLLCGMGFTEIITNSIVNSKYYAERADLVKMLNNLSSELDVMRPTLLECGLEVVNYNCNRKSNDLCIFEFGNVYHTLGNEYHEETHLGLWVTGNVQGKSWAQKSTKASLYYLKGILNNLLVYSGLVNVVYIYDADSIVVKWKNIKLAELVMVPEKRLQEFDIKQEVYYCSIYWQNWLKAAASFKTKYKGIPKFPKVERDLAMIVSKNIKYEEIMRATETLKLDALSGFGLFDVFESEKIGKENKSLALSFIFQSKERTLNDAEIEGMMNQLIDFYKTKFHAQIREK